MTFLEDLINNSTGKDKEGLEHLAHSFSETIAQNTLLQKKIEIITHENNLLKKRLFGSASEKTKNISQLWVQDEMPLFNEFELIAHEVGQEKQAPVIEKISVSSPKKKGRKRLPTHLPREIVEHDLLDDDKTCTCGADLVCIGTQVSEELDYIPATLHVLEHHCKKYICSACVKAKEINPTIDVTAKTAKKPAQLIKKSFASPSLLAQIVLAKFRDHLPLYRQEQIFDRLNIQLSRQTMSEWMIRVGQAIIPLTNLLQDEIRHYDVAYADETTIQVLNEPGRRAQTKSYMWCFIGGPTDRRAIIYQYHSSREGEIPFRFFDDYKGALHCDGYLGYARLIKSDLITGINCMAHVRRSTPRKCVVT